MSVVEKYNPYLTEAGTELFSAALSLAENYIVCLSCVVQPCTQTLGKHYGVLINM